MSWSPRSIRRPIGSSHAMGNPRGAARRVPATACCGSRPMTWPRSTGSPSGSSWATGRPHLEHLGLPSNERSRAQHVGTPSDVRPLNPRRSASPAPLSKALPGSNWPSLAFASLLGLPSSPEIAYDRHATEDARASRAGRAGSGVRRLHLLLPGRSGPRGRVGRGPGRPGDPGLGGPGGDPALSRVDGRDQGRDRRVRRLPGCPLPRPGPFHVCAEELEHAIGVGNGSYRCCAGDRSGSVPPSLAARNWIDATGGLEVQPARSDRIQLRTQPKRSLTGVPTPRSPCDRRAPAGTCLCSMSKSPDRHCARRVEDAGRIGALCYHDMRRDHVHAAGDGPRVQIVDVGDTVHLHDVPADLIQIDVLGRCFQGAHRRPRGAGARSVAGSAGRSR